MIAPGEKPLAPVVLDATDGSLDPEAAELAALRSLERRKSHGCRATRRATRYTGIC